MGLCGKDIGSVGAIGCMTSPPALCMTRSEHVRGRPITSRNGIEPFVLPTIRNHRNAHSCALGSTLTPCTHTNTQIGFTNTNKHTSKQARTPLSQPDIAAPHKTHRCRTTCVSAAGSDSVPGHPLDHPWLGPDSRRSRGPGSFAPLRRRRGLLVVPVSKA